MGKPKCSAQNKSGQGCRAFAIADGRHCWTHSPAHAEDRRRACSAGGRKATQLRAIEGRRPKLDDAAGLVRFTANLVHRLLANELEVDVVRCVVYALTLQRQLIETATIETRVNELVAQIETMQSQGKGPRRGWGA